MSNCCFFFVTLFVPGVEGQDSMVPSNGGPSIDDDLEDVAGDFMELGGSLSSNSDDGDDVVHQRSTEVCCC